MGTFVCPKSPIDRRSVKQEKKSFNREKNSLHPSFLAFYRQYPRDASAAMLAYHLMLVDVSLALFVMVHQPGRHAIVIWISRDWLSILLYCIALHCIAVYCIALHCLSRKLSTLPHPSSFYPVTYLLVTHCSDVLSSPHAQQVWSLSVITLTVVIHQVPFQCDH